MSKASFKEGTVTINRNRQTFKTFHENQNIANI